MCVKSERPRWPGSASGRKITSGLDDHALIGIEAGVFEIPGDAGVVTKINEFHDTRRLPQPQEPYVAGAERTVAVVVDV